MFQPSCRRVSLALLTISAAALSLAISATRAGTARDVIFNPTPAVAASRVSAAPDRYKIDAGRSQFTVRAFVGGMLSAFAHNHTIAVRNFTGEARLEDASVQISVRADSLAVTDKVSAKDKQEIERKMRDDVLETSRYAEITFRSVNVQAQKTGDGQFKVRIEGDLTLHGVKRREIINAQVSVNGDTIRGRGEFQIRQSDYKIKPPSVGMGTIKVKDTLKLSFDILAHK
jgi:polyisoprenoid-binding protein YceI